MRSPQKRSRDKKRTDPPGGSSTPPEDPDRSSSIALPPGPTAWWKWRCELCRKDPSFVARAKAATDLSGRDRVYVWEYQADQQEGILENVRWGTVERGKPPPCPWCGPNDCVTPVGPAALPDDLQIAYDALKRMLRARPNGPKPPQLSPWPNEPGDDGDLPS